MVGRLHHGSPRHSGCKRQRRVSECGVCLIFCTILSAIVCRYVSLVSPLLTMLFLLCLSGLPTSEGVNQAKYMKTPA